MLVRLLGNTPRSVEADLPPEPWQRPATWFFFGDDAGSFEAVDAQSGKPLWHFNTGQDMSASPMSYAVAGKQYVAIAAGSDIFSFALP